MTFSLFEVSIEKSFEEVSNRKVRGSVISIAISIGKMMTIMATMFVGVMAKYFSYRAGMIIISIILVIMSLFLIVKLAKNSKIVEKIIDKIYYAIV
jgi:sugar phosphate permease